MIQLLFSKSLSFQRIMFLILIFHTPPNVWTQDFLIVPRHKLVLYGEKLNDARSLTRLELRTSCSDTMLNYMKQPLFSEILSFQRTVFVIFIYNVIKK